MLIQCLNAFTMSLIACAEPQTAPTVPKIIKKTSFPAQNLHNKMPFMPFHRCTDKLFVEFMS